MQLSSFHILMLLFICLHCSAQINPVDSTLSVIGYWNKNDSQKYQVTAEKYKITEGDTTDQETTKYTVAIIIKDAAIFSWMSSSIDADSG